MTNTLATVELAQAGQSPWLDFISRDMLRSGKLKSFIQDQGVLGVTSNPSIFQKAISQEGGGYDQEISRMIKRGASTFEIYDALTIADIQEACDLFLPVYKDSKGEHGYVSLEVIPSLAYDVDETIAEAKRLHKKVNRPNVMIKIPATPEGIPAIRATIAAGINVNVTLIFSLHHYREVANAYLDGLKDLKESGGDLSKVRSVASVFVSRFDTYIDKKLEGSHEVLKHKAAVANSKLIYQEFKQIFGSSKAKALAKDGANVQKVLWGSTSTKSPSLSDLLYVENLIGSETVNTMPLNTLEALLDHGIVRRDTIEEGLEDARMHVRMLKQKDLDLLNVGEILQKQGVQAFIDSFDDLMRTLEKQREAAQKKGGKTFGATSFSVPNTALSSKHTREVNERQAEGFLYSLLDRDPSLWKQDLGHQIVIRNRMGWLRSQEWVLGKLYEFERLCKDIKEDKIKDIVLLGMGGSSLAPEVMSLICKKAPKAPRFHVMDTTDPSTLLGIEKKISLKSSLFIVASKSGGTIETLSQYRYFYQKVQKAYGKKNVKQIGRHFIAITDGGSNLEADAKEKMFRRVFVNPSDIGGRYSAMSLFGQVPAALMGCNVRAIIKSARDFFADFQKQTIIKNNPAVSLGLLLGVLANQGVNKMTLWTTPSLEPFGAWLEQLVAESTGKEGKGIVPVDKEGPQDIIDYGEDRVFVVLKLKGDKAPAWSKQIPKLKKAGYAVVEVQWPTRESIGAEFLRWEIVTAVASAVMKINPFDEPNVKESKENTARLLKQLTRKGSLKEPKKMIKPNQKEAIGSFFEDVEPGSYGVLLAYTPRDSQTEKAFRKICNKLTRALKIPFGVSFGPRYLHSNGQLHKGGIRNGLFLEFFMKDSKDVSVPEAGYRFGQLKHAQALGDLEALESKGLPVLTVQLGSKPETGIRAFEKSIDQVLREISR